MSLTSDLAYLRSNANHHFRLDAQNKNVPCSVDSFPSK